MTLEETINFIKKGSYSELEDIDLVGIVDFLEELQLSRKALDLACGGVAFNYCKNCRLEHRYVNCSGCNTKEDGWVDYYLDIARRE